jgi:hypothetical protein
VVISVITGDIVHSRQLKDPTDWLNPLKRLFHQTGTSPESWEIYRGDSFQIEITPPEALLTALQIKSVVRQVRGLDVRIAIGIGEKSYDSPRISESTGEAFVRSGQLLEQLKAQKMTMGIATFDGDFDEEFNMMLKLALIVLNSWSVNSAEIAELMLTSPELSQTRIGKQLGIAQSSVSERIHRGSLYEIIELENYYRKRVQRLTPDV